MRITALGGYQTDFARNWTKEGLDVSDLVREVIERTLDRAAIAPEQIESLHVGNAFGQLYTGQGHLGAMPATVVPELWGVPAMRHEAACASGSIAALTAMAEIESGRYDCVLLLGSRSSRRRCPAPRQRGSRRRPPGSGRETDVEDGHLGVDVRSRRRGVRRALRARRGSTCGRSARTESAPTRRTNPNAQTRDLEARRRELLRCGRRTRTPSSRAGSAGTTAARSPTAARASCSSPIAGSPRSGAGRARARGARGLGPSAPSGSRQRESSSQRSRGAETFVMPHVRDAITDAWSARGDRGRGARSTRSRPTTA